MRDIFKEYYKSTIYTSIIYLIFGLILLLNPNGVIGIISMIIGIIAIVVGIISIMLFYKLRSNLRLISGLFCFISGIVLITHTNILATIIPLIIGIGMILQGLKKLELAATLKQHNSDNFAYMLIVAILNILIGIIIVLNPIMGAIITTQVIGVIIIIYAISAIIDNMVFKNKIKQTIKIIEE